MRKIMVAAAILAAVAVGGAVLLYSSLDSIVKATIEKVGSEVTGTRVRVDDVDISLGSGSGALRGLTVTNPEGFERDDAFQFDRIALKIDLTTIASDPIVIEEVVVEKPRIRYELGKAGTNVGHIQRNVEGSSTSSGASDGPNLIIKNLYFRDGQINLAGASLLKSGVTTPLPDLHLQDIGSEEGGASPSVIARRVIGALGRKVATAVASVDLSGVGDALGKGASETKDAAKTTGKKIKGLFKKGED